MPDREKVIKGLQIERECISRDCEGDCGKCDLVRDRNWLLSVYDDALALLKEQEAKPIIGKDSVEGAEVGTCPRCNRMIVNPARFCRYCGQEVTWE